MASARVILHADMDAFYAAIEQRDDPALRGRPVVVGGPGRRGVVSTASYEARPFGVRSAMPMALARQRCPQAVFLPPRMAHYAAESAKVAAVFESFTPLVEPLSLDEAFLDVTGSVRLFGAGEAIARRLQRDVLAATGLTVSVGVAGCKYVAKVASDLRKPSGVVVVPAGEEAAFLAPLDVSRLWGAGARTQAALRKGGVATIGDLQARTGDELVRLVGEAAGRHFWKLARGIDERAVVPDREARSISHETTFAVDERDDERLLAVLLELCEGVGRRLRRAQRVARTVRLKLRWPDFTTLSRQVRVAAPTDDDMELFAHARELLAAARGSGRPVRLIGVGGSDLAAAGGAQQGGLFGQPPVRRRNLQDAVDAIRDRFGRGAIRRGRSARGDGEGG